jgi:ATP-dependent helicase/nuclease subunit A
VQTIETPDGEVKRYARPEDIAAPPGSAAERAPIVAIELPAWLRTSVSEIPAGDQVLRPSDASDEDDLRPRAGTSVVARSQAMQRGTLVHRLLQSLPDVAAGKRRDAALKYLARNAAEWPDAERMRLAERVLTVIEEPRFAQVFAAGSRAEVSIVGRVTPAGQPQALVSGQIDRLAVTETEVLIVDFKTNHEPPRSVAAVPPAYVRQLALYRAVLGQLYPGRAIRAALLWTETAELMELSASALDAELAFSARVGDRA